MPAVVLVLTLSLAQQPVPQPFPRPGSPPPRPAPVEQPGQAAVTTPPPAAASGVISDEAPDPAVLGVSVYPGSQFIASYDAGRGQRFYLYGTLTPYVDIVTYYRTLLRNRGNVVFEVPATHVFEIGRFREESMAFPPSVTVKDYQTQSSAGYPNPRRGAQPDHFPTIIQIVPAPPGSER